MPTRSQAVIAISSLMLKNNLVNPFRYLETVHSMWIVYPNSLRWLLFKIYCPHFSISHQLDQKSVTERHFGANCSNFSKSTSLYIRQVYHPLWRHHSRGRVVWKQLSLQSSSQSRQFVYTRKFSNFLRKKLQNTLRKWGLIQALCTQKVFD